MLADALIRCLFSIAQLAIKEGGSRRFGDYYRFSNDGIAIIVRNLHEPGHELTSEVMADVLWILWTFSLEAMLVSATFEVEHDGKSV